MGLDTTGASDCVLWVYPVGGEEADVSQSHV